MCERNAHGGRCKRVQTVLEEARRAPCGGGRCPVRGQCASRASGSVTGGGVASDTRGARPRLAPRAVDGAMVVRQQAARAAAGAAAGIRSSPARSRHIAVCGCSVPRIGTLRPACANRYESPMNTRTICPDLFPHPARECAIEVVAPLWLTRSFSVHGSEQSMFSHRDCYVTDASSDDGIH